MKATKAGIWMDHIHAYVIEFTTEPMESTLIESRLSHELRKPDLTFGETRMHSIENREQAAFYKDLTLAIRGYREIVLFGPGKAKMELFNLLHENHVFQNIIVKTEQTDRMTLGEMNAFVREHFSRR